MTNRGDKGEAARRLAARSAAEAQLALDHFVEGFEWKMPTGFALRDGVSADPHRPQRLLVFGIEYPAPRVHTGAGLLEGFLKLETDRDESILAYARRWGPLWLCKHDLPYGHSPTCEPYHDDDLQFQIDHELEEFEDEEVSAEPTLEDLRATDPGERIALEFQGDITWYGEELSAWRALSRQMRATLRIARSLQDGKRPEMADWDALPFLSETLFDLVAPSFEDTFNPADLFENDAALVRELAMHGLPTDGYAPVDSDTAPEDQFAYRVHAVGRLRLAESTGFQRKALSQVLNYWLRVGGVRPQHEWTGRRPQIQLGGHGLMGALAVQMLFDCSRTDGLAVCTGCGIPFLPGPRRPRRDRNAYCSDCGLKAAARDAAARYRQTAKYKATYGKWRQSRQEERIAD